MPAVRVLVLASFCSRQVEEEWLELPSGATFSEALERSELYRRAQTQFEAPPVAGLWSHKCDPDQILQEDDRIDICRPLRVDPKVARRERFNRQGVRSAGLFAKRRTGAKSGY